jgi:hypothetical protein
MKKEVHTETQNERFIKAARELGCDPSEERFVERVRKLAAAGPQHRPTKGGAKRKTASKSSRP